ncbi:MAG: BspA family leucine-rich repeat surface protein, partial [Gammaproteobacteria bacterium]|nr:BspA family leucine-rich repeat surface protein [Gammaproteobacteria bacterium]
VTHDFGTAGVKTIRITGDFPQVIFKNNSDVKKLISIDQWGSYPWSSMREAFRYASNLVNNAADTPNLSVCSDLTGMFNGASLIGSSSETSNWNWNTSNISDMDSMFIGASSFNQNIGSWNTTNVSRMPLMFSHADSLIKI